MKNYNIAHSTKKHVCYTFYVPP